MSLNNSADNKNSKGKAATDCPKCNQSFGIEKNKPMMLSCAHTYCEACIPKLNNRSCEICRIQINRTFGYVSINPNYALIELMKEVQTGERQLKRDPPYCPTHNKSIDMICHDCSELICPDCHDSAHAHHLLRRPSPLVLALLRRVHADQSALRGFPQTGDVREYEGLHAKWGRLLEEGAIEELESVDLAFIPLISRLRELHGQARNRIFQVQSKLLDQLAKIDAFARKRLTEDLLSEVERELKAVRWEAKAGSEEWEVIEIVYESAKVDLERMKQIMENKDGLRSVDQAKEDAIKVSQSRLSFAEKTITKINSIMFPTGLSCSSSEQQIINIDNLRPCVQSFSKTVMRLADSIYQPAKSDFEISSFPIFARTRALNGRVLFGFDPPIPLTYKGATIGPIKKEVDDTGTLNR